MDFFDGDTLHEEGNLERFVSTLGPEERAAAASALWGVDALWAPDESTAPQEATPGPMEAERTESLAAFVARTEAPPDEEQATMTKMRMAPTEEAGWASGESGFPLPSGVRRGG